MPFTRVTTHRGSTELSNASDASVCRGSERCSNPAGRCASPLPPPAAHPRAREAGQAIERLDHAAGIERGSRRLVRRPLAHIGGWWESGSGSGSGIRNPNQNSPESRIPDPGSRILGSRRVGRRARGRPDVPAVPRAPLRQMVPRGSRRLTSIRRPSSCQLALVLRTELIVAIPLLPTAYSRVHRASRRIGLQLSSGRLVARNAHRACGVARLSGAGAARCRRRLRRTAFS